MAKLTAKTRRGLDTIIALVQSDIDTMEPGDLTAKQRAEVQQAMEWLISKSLPPKPKHDCPSCGCDAPTAETVTPVEKP